MSFKISNNNEPNFKRNYHQEFEIVKDFQELNPLTSTTRLHAHPDYNYFVWLPATHATGQEKIIQLVNADSGNTVYVTWNDAVDGSFYGYEMDVMGDTLVLYSTPEGWHVFPHVDWY